MPRPTPIVPSQPIPLRADAIFDIQQRAAYWARLSVLASAIIGALALLQSLRGQLPWGYAAALLALPLLPIAAQTRIEELGRKLLDQVRDTHSATDKARAQEAA